MFLNILAQIILLAHFIWQNWIHCLQSNVCHHSLDGNPCECEMLHQAVVIIFCNALWILVCYPSFTLKYVLEKMFLGLIRSGRALTGFIKICEAANWYWWDLDRTSDLRGSPIVSLPEKSYVFNVCDVICVLITLLIMFFCPLILYHLL